MTKILVTGGSGFIGNTVVKFLGEEGFEVNVAILAIHGENHFPRKSKSFLHISSASHWIKLARCHKFHEYVD